MGYAFTINMTECSLAVAVVFIPVLWHRFFRPSFRRLILELKADSYNLGVRDGEERARQKTLRKQSRDNQLTLDALHMRIDILCERITELMEETRFLWEGVEEEEEEEEKEKDGNDDTHRYRSVYSDPNDRQLEAMLSDDIAVNGDLERYGFTTEVMRRDNGDELEIGDQGRGGALLMGIGGQDFLDRPD